MNNVEVNDRLLCLFQEIVDFSGNDLSDDLTPQHISEWDSINHITLMMEVQLQFGITFTTLEVKSIKSVGELRSAILKHLSADN